MTEKEMNALIAEGNAIDTGAAEHAEAAANGQLDAKGNIIQSDPASELDTKAQEWFVVPKTIAWAITTVFPETAPAYSDERCMELAKAIVPVAEKYGWSGVNSPELMLVAGAAMFCAPGYLAYKARQEAKREAARKAAEEGSGGGDGR